MIEVTDPFWSNDFSVLYRPDRALEFFVTDDQSVSEKLNSIARFGVYVSVILSMYHKDPKYLSLCVLTFVITYFVYSNIGCDVQENLENVSKKSIVKKTTKPTINNPFGNSSIVDIIDNPDRAPMTMYADHTEESLKVKNDVEEKFNYNLYKDLGDLYGRQNSQRQYYTTPSKGSIPADPNGDFKKWLYGSMPSCKDNTYECGKTMYEDPRSKRPIFVNPNENPVETSAKETK